MPFDYQTRIWTVEKGDWLTKIAQAVYNKQSKWNTIAKANKEKIGSTYNFEKYVNGKYNVIYPGQKLYCPLASEAVKKITTFNSRSNWFIIRINDEDVQLASGLKVNIQLNGALRTSSFSLPYTSDSNYKQFDKCEIFIKGVQVLKGFLVRPNPTFSKDSGSKITWNAVTPAFDIVKSNFKNNAKESKTFKNLTFKTICDNVLRDYDIVVDFKHNDDRNIKFKKVSISSNETIFSFLAKLGEQKGLFLHGLADGNLIFISNTDQPKEVGRFFNETENVVPSYNYDELASQYRATEQRSKTGSYRTASNPFITRNIFKNVSKDQNFEGDLQEFVDHYQAKQFANAFSVTVTDDNILDDNEQLWEVNSLIKCFTRTIGYSKPKNFLINSIDFDFEKSRNVAILKGVLPETRSNKLPEEMPFL